MESRGERRGYETNVYSTNSANNSDVEKDSIPKNFTNPDHDLHDPKISLRKLCSSKFHLTMPPVNKGDQIGPSKPKGPRELRVPRAGPSSPSKLRPTSSAGSDSFKYAHSQTRGIPSLCANSSNSYQDAYSRQCQYVNPNAWYTYRGRVPETH